MECNNISPVLEISKLSVSAWKTILLQDISLQLHAGEILAIIGPNGAGKTSLLKAVVGDLPLDKGNVRACNFDLSTRRHDIKANRQLAKRLAMLPQLSLLNFPYRVEEVVELGRAPHDSGLQQDKDIVAQSLTAMDITHLRGRLYTRLSGGEKQRVQLARVMTQIWRAVDAQPRLLLLDEPTSSLDLGHQQQLMQAIRDFATQGVAIVMVLHDINLAARNADRVLALQQGRMIGFGPPSKIINAKLIQQLFDVDLTQNNDSNKTKPIALEI